MTGSSESPGAFTLTAFAAAVLLGGGNFLAVRFSNLELDPFWGAGLRFTAAAVVFVLIAIGSRLSWPKGRQLVTIGVFGLFSFTLSYALMYWALVRVTAGMAAVVLALVPLLTPFLAAAQRLERLSRRAVLGGLIALGGIVVMTVSPGGLVLPLSGLVAILIAAVTVGESVILGKRVSGNHPVMTNAVAMSFGGLSLLAISALAGETWVVPTRPEVVWSVLYLVSLGSLGLFVLILLVVRKWTASATAYAFVLFPVVTMGLEAWLADEPLTGRGVAGALIVMGGVWVGALAPSRSTTAAPSSEVSPAEA